MQVEETVSHGYVAYRPPIHCGDFPSGSRAGASGCREAFGFQGFWEGNENWGVSCQVTGEAWFWTNPQPNHCEFAGPKIQMVNLVLGLMLADKV